MGHPLFARKPAQRPPWTLHKSSRRVAGGVEMMGISRRDTAPLLLLLAFPGRAHARVSPGVAALVSMVRLRDGVDFLYERLEEGKYDGFQTGVKLLMRDTAVRQKAREAAEGLAEMGFPLRVKSALTLGEVIEYNMAQVVEYDGWDSPLIEREINDVFTRMTPEKVDFARKGMGVVRQQVARFLGMFPPSEVAKADKLYRQVYLSEGHGADEGEAEFVSF